MMNYILLLDAAPDPISAGVGIAGLILIGVVVLMITGAALVGFVFLIKRLRSNDAARSQRLTAGDVGLNLDNAASQSNPQPQSSPNHP